MRRINLTIDTDSVYSYTIEKSKTTGTFSIKTVGTVPEKKEAVDLEGRHGIVERVGPVRSHTENGQDIAGRILPIFSQEFISITHLDKGDGESYSATEIANEIGSKAGVALDIFVPDVRIKEFSYIGRHLVALENIANELCADLIQQENRWKLVPKNYSNGSFSIEEENLINYSVSDQADVQDELLTLANSLKDSLIRADELKRQLEELEADLADLDDEDEEEVTYSYLGTGNTMGDISFEFGWKNGAHQHLESNHELIGGSWETWIPEEDSSQNPTAKNKKYYQIQPILDSEGEPTGALRGCYSLSLASVRVTVSKPSNASGQYFVKGKGVNVPFLSDVNWKSWGWKPAERDQEIYFDFSLSVPNVHDVPSATEDKQLYRLDATLDYIPVRAGKWGFIGTVDETIWPIQEFGVVTSFINTQGRIYDLQKQEVQRVTLAEDIPGTVLAKKAIFDSDNNLAGFIDSTQVISYTGEWGGNLYGTAIMPREHIPILFWFAPLWGFISDNLINQAWPGLDGETLGKVIDFYHVSEFLGAGGSEEDDLEKEKKRLELELEMLANKIECLRRAIRVYYIELVDTVEASAEAWIAYNRFYERNKNNETETVKAQIEELLDVARLKDDELVDVISSFTGSLIVKNFSFIYNGELPEVAQDFSILDYEGIIQSFSFSASQSSCTLNLTVHRSVAHA